MNEKLKEWENMESWLKKGITFNVEVKRWSYTSNKILKNMWNIYVYYFRLDDDFDKVKENNDDLLGYNFHGGITYHKVEDSFIRIGCDYAHAGDDRFHTYSTKEEALEVFKDADEIYQYLINRPIKKDKWEMIK